MCFETASCGSRSGRREIEVAPVGAKTTREARVKLERGPLGMYVAPTLVLASDVIFQEITVAGVVVRALVDSGARRLVLAAIGISGTKLK